MAKENERWTPAYAGEVLDEADRARSDRAYARSHGVGGKRISWWRKRLDRPRRRGVSARGSSDVAFVEVSAKRASSVAMLEVSLSNGRQFRVAVQTDVSLVSRIADALDREC